jgi:hydrogenase expression/formation protein HypE
LSEGKLRRCEEELRWSEEKLRWSEEKLRWSEEKLRWSEEKLRWSEEKLRWSEEKLRWSEEKLRWSEEKLRRSGEELRGFEEKLSLVRGKASLVHGIAVLSVREGIAFESPVESDCAPVAALAAALIEGGVDVRCLRDPTRGGVASVLNEIAEAAAVGIEVDERAVPVSDEVAGASELLGLDPLYVACEGRMIAFVPEEQADRALALLRADPRGQGAARIGRVTAEAPGVVALRTRLGARRLLDLLSGEQLPRIC